MSIHLEIRALARAAVCAGLLTAASPGLAADVTFIMQNSHEFAVEVELYSQDRNHVWPGNGQVYLSTMASRSRCRSAARRAN